MKKYIRLFAMLALCLLLGGCGPKGPIQATISLLGNPTTGYEWTYYFSEEGILKQTHSEFTEGTPEGGNAGSGGTYTFSFTAMKEGTVDVVFAYARSFEDVEPLDSITYTFTVDKNGILSLTGSAGTLTTIPAPVLSDG